MTVVKSSIKDRYNQITGSVTTVQNAVNLFRDARERYNETFLYTAVLEESSFVYQDVMGYIDAKTNTRNFKFLSTREGIYRYYDSDATATFYIGSHKIKVTLRKPQGVSLRDPDMDSLSTSSSMKEELMFTCKTAEGLKALENLLVEFTNKKKATNKTNYIVNTDKWGDWDYDELPYKNMDSVFLPHGDKEALVADVQRFINSEQKFKDVGMPYHRGYAFYGEPGNGKSSIVLGLANHFGMDLYNLPLSAVKEDNGLAKCIAGVKKHSILLIEDIDIFSGTMKREQSGGAHAPTLASLLNGLDGVSTPHGMITVITTNHFERLDPALVRHGRVDYKLELKAPVPSQVSDMFARVFREPLGFEPRTLSSMAEVADVFKRNLDDPEAVRMEFKNE